jgi:hypothetical protein
VLLPTTVPVVLELSPLFEFELTAGVDLNLGTRAWFTEGFAVEDGQWHWINGVSHAPYGSISGFLEGSVFAGADIAIKAFDVAGIFMKLGPELKARGEVKPTEACATLSAALRADMGVRLDLWIKRYDLQLASTSVPYDFATRCFAKPGAEPAPVDKDAARGKILRKSNGASWFVTDDLVAHPIPNGGTYLCLTAWNGTEVIDGASDAYVSSFVIGSMQSCVVIQARDRIIRKSTGEAWYVDADTVAHWIPNGGTYLCLTAWKGKQVIAVTDDQVNALTRGADQTCRADEAVDKVIRKSDGTAYYVDGNTVAHWIPNGGTYLCLTAWKGKQVIAVTDDQVNALTRGADQTCRADEAVDKVIRKSDGTAYYVDGNTVAHWIPNGGTYNCLVAVYGKAVINNVTNDQVNALTQGNNQGCRALLVGPDNTSFYVDSSDERKWVPDGGTFVCIQNRGVPVYRYSNWNTINLFVDRHNWASC